MRVVINGWFLAHNPHTGSGQYLRALLDWLPRVAPQHEYHLVLPQPGVEVEKIRSHVIPCGASHLDKLRFEQILFPRACGELKVDVAHVPYWAAPLRSPAPVVVTIHDLIPRVLPEYRGGLRVRLYTALVSASAAGAALVLADSDASRGDILRLLNLPPQRVRTIYLAAEAGYAPASDASTDEFVFKKYNLPDEYVLYLGGFDARKNVPALLAAWTWAAESIGARYPLVLAGRLPKPHGRLFADYPRLAAELNIADTVQFIGAVDEADKPALYRRASVFVYPSRYEGFGLPPLEAMACGTPVVTTAAASLAEVVGTAGYIVPPDDARALGAALLTCVVEPSVAQALRERGLAQAQKFSWDKTARETAAAYEAAV